MLVKELDEKKWEKFDVFGKKGFLRIATTDSSIDSIRLIDGNEKRVPYVTRSEAVNGIAQFVSENNYEFGSDEAGCITVGLDTQTVFYQPHKFVTGQNIQIVTGDSLNEDSAHFYVTILKKQMDAKFNWGGNGATLSRMKRLEQCFLFLMREFQTMNICQNIYFKRGRLYLENTGITSFSELRSWVKAAKFHLLPKRNGILF